jgi:hypothetical protein
MKLNMAHQIQSLHGKNGVKAMTIARMSGNLDKM